MNSHDKGSAISTQRTAAKPYSTGCGGSKRMRRSPRAGSARVMLCSASDSSEASNLEVLRVAAFDLFRAFFDAFGVFLHQFDVGQFANAGFFDRLGMRRILARIVDEELLSLARMHPVLEEPRGIRIGRTDHDRARAGGDRRPFRGINDVDGLARLLAANDQIARAVDHNGALTERDALGRV